MNFCKLSNTNSFGIKLLTAVTAWACFFVAQSAQATDQCLPLGYEISGNTPRAYDGDGLYVDGEKIRLWGIQAPELHARGGQDSLRSLKEIATGPVRCIASGSCSYDRVVARCWKHDGTDIANEQVRSGHAIDWPKYSNGFYSQ